MTNALGDFAKISTMTIASESSHSTVDFARAAGTPCAMGVKGVGGVPHVACQEVEIVVARDNDVPVGFVLVLEAVCDQILEQLLELGRVVRECGQRAFNSRSDVILRRE